VPVLRVDYVSIEAVLLGVWQVSDGGKCDPGSGEIATVGEALIVQKSESGKMDEGDGIFAA